MTPKLRFPEFRESWNEVAIGDIATISRGRFSPRPRNDPRYYGGDTEFIQTSEVVGANPNILNGSKSLNKEGIKVSKVFPSGTIVMTIAANIGYVGFANRPVAFPDSLVGISAFEEILPKYIYYSLSRKQRRLDYIAEEAAQKNITSPTVRKFKIWHTRNQQEQVTLTNFFDVINLKINLLNKKKEALETYKKGLMQKIFSQELRFKREDGTDYPEWDYQPLGDLAYITSGKSNREDSDTEATYHFFDRSSDVRRSGIYLFDDDAVIVAGEGQEFIPKKFSGKFDLHQRAYAIMKFGDRLSYEYCYYFIFHHRRYFERMAVGTTVLSLRLPMFQKMMIQLPSMEEQDKIVAVLTNLDTYLKKVSFSIQSTESLKKGLLQQMFV